MQVLHRQIHHCSFEDYLRLEGVSYSSIRNTANKPATPKMHLGTAVHNYLLEGKQPDSPLIRPLAQKLAVALGSLLRYLKPEVGITATFVHSGLQMQYKGRVDLCIVGRIVIDIKVTTLTVQQQLKHFGYVNQFSGYAIAMPANKVLMLTIHPTTHQTNLYELPIETAFWEQQVLNYGTP